MDAPPKFKGTTVSYILEGTNFPGFGKMHTDPKYKLKLSEAAPLSSWWGSSWRTRCIRGSSKTVKNHNMFLNELDVELHPTPWHVSCWGTTWTESAVHSLVHPKIGSDPTELRQLVTGANCVGVERRSRAPRHRDELRDDWEPQGAGFLRVSGVSGIIVRE